MQVLYNDFPKLLLAAVLKAPNHATAAAGASEHRRNDGAYVCPCYANAHRSHKTFVMTVNLKTDDPPHKWVLRGVALLCAKDP